MLESLLGWAAVKEPRLSCHNTETRLFTTCVCVYIYIYPDCGNRNNFLNSNPVGGFACSVCSRNLLKGLLAIAPSVVVASSMVP